MNRTFTAKTFIVKWFLAINGLLAATSLSSVVIPQLAEAKSASALGDLSSFEKLGKDTLKLVESKDFAGAKTKITELESAWDKAEETLRAKEPNSWRTVDKAIDKALSQVRADIPDATSSKEALKKMLDQMQSAGGK